jgi:hypothetical protein
MIVNVRAEDIKELNSSAFDKIPKIYGTVNGKRASLQKLPNLFSPQQASAAWKKKISLYSQFRKSIKNNPLAWFTDNGPLPSQKVTLLVRTSGKNKINASFREIELTPPVFTEFQNASHSITSAAPGSQITITGKYFGSKIPKVSLFNPNINSYIRLKVLKPLHYTDAKNKSGNSCMDVNTGESRIEAVIPAKKISPGTYYLILDNKIGIAADEKTGTLPELLIK